MGNSIEEIIKGLELTRVKISEVKTSCKLHSDKLEDLDKKIRISLNFLPDRAEALTLLTESSAKTKMWGAELEFIMSKLDISIKELKNQEKRSKKPTNN